MCENASRHIWQYRPNGHMGNVRMDLQKKHLPAYIFWKTQKSLTFRTWIHGSCQPTTPCSGILLQRGKTNSLLNFPTTPETLGPIWAHWAHRSHPYFSISPPSYTFQFCRGFLQEVKTDKAIWRHTGTHARTSCGGICTHCRHASLHLERLLSLPEVSHLRHTPRRQISLS